MVNKIDYALQMIQLYSYLLPTVKVGNAIMDFRAKHTIKHTKRRKDLEYGWIFKRSFLVFAYTVTLENGRTYTVYAHDFEDMKYFLSRLEVKEAPIRRYKKNGTERMELHYEPDKYGEPLAKPFWWRGRVYEYTGVKYRF